MNIKLSEYIMLGIGTVETMVAGDINSCALGIALNAAGVPAINKVSWMSVNARYFALYVMWPWLSEPVEPTSRVDWCDAVWTRFDNCVIRDRSMTIEQLADYVKSVEPECGECNRFKCTCNTMTLSGQVTAGVCIERTSC